MDKDEVILRVKKYIEIIKQYFSVKKVILFGSYHRGTHRKDSDIAIAIVVDSAPGDWLTAEARLFSLRTQVDSRIEPVLIEEGCDESGFLENISLNGEVIYAR